MTENTQNSMELYVQAYSIAIVLASRPLYGLKDVDILDKSVFVADIVDRIQHGLESIEGRLIFQMLIKSPLAKRMGF